MMLAEVAAAASDDWKHLAYSAGAVAIAALTSWWADQKSKQRHEVSKAAISDGERAALKREAERDAKIDILWGFLLDGRKLKAEQTGLGTMNSPLIVSAERRQLVPIELAKLLREFYRSLPQPLGPDELEFKIQESFRDDIINELCRPHGISNGDGLLIAAAVAREDEA